jgi:lactoylglutathione lyase
MNEKIAFDHIHLISRNPQAAVDWYVDIFGGEVTRVQPDLRGALQVDVRVGGMTIVVRGQRPGEQPVATKPMQPFASYSSHDEWGTDHFGFTYQGDLRSFCEDLKRKGVRMAVEPWEFKPGVVICYVSAPDGVSIELIQVDS